MVETYYVQVINRFLERSELVSIHLAHVNRGARDVGSDKYFARTTASYNDDGILK